MIRLGLISNFQCEKPPLISFNSILFFHDYLEWSRINAANWLRLSRSFFSKTLSTHIEREELMSNIYDNVITANDIQAMCGTWSTYNEAIAGRKNPNTDYTRKARNTRKSCWPMLWACVTGNGNAQQGPLGWSLFPGVPLDSVTAAEGLSLGISPCSSSEALSELSSGKKCSPNELLVARVAAGFAPIMLIPCLPYVGRVSKMPSCWIGVVLTIIRKLRTAKNKRVIDTNLYWTRKNRDEHTETNIYNRLPLRISS